MSTIFTPNCVQVELIYDVLGTRCENVYNVTNGGPATLANLVALYDIFRLWEANTAKVQRHAACSLVLISLKAMDNAGAPFYEAATNLPIAGTFPGLAAPVFMTIACKHNTGLAGRSFRGRTYWIGIGVGHINNDGFLASARTAIAAAYNTLRTSLATAGWTFVVNSRYSGVDANGRAIPRAAGVMTTITQTSVEGFMDTQRHRKLPYQR